MKAQRLWPTAAVAILDRGRSSGERPKGASSGEAAAIRPSVGGRASKRLCLAVLGMALSCSIGCDEEQPARTTLAKHRFTTVVPAEDPTEQCADVGTLRVCWGEPRRWAECPDELCLVDRPVPEVAAPTRLGWRCTGSGEERVCRERSLGVGPFECAGDRCTQLHPRLPDDGEWTCTSSGGATVCAGGDSAAGIAAPTRDPGWICGERLGKEKERVCLDLSPDFPDGQPQGWQCRYHHDPVSRVCVRAPKAHQLGDRCSPAAPCVDGSLCVRERCVPPKPAPSCFLNRDCPSGACRFGTCRAESG